MNEARPLAALTFVLPFAIAAAPAHAQSTPPSAHAPVAKPFARLAVPAATITALCARPDVGCATDAGPRLTVYRAPGDPADTAWAIVAARPVLLKMTREGSSGWNVVRRWDFTQTAHSHAAVSAPDDPIDPASIYPALYPTGPGAWAIALVSDFNEMYSGGDGTFSIADFVVLSDTGATDTAKPLYAGVDFSCSQLVRACFTEEDERARHGQCHDEYSGYLTLEYALSAVPGRYAWTATWHSSGGDEHRVPFPPSGGDVSHRFAAEDLCGGVSQYQVVVPP